MTPLFLLVCVSVRATVNLVPPSGLALPSSHWVRAHPRLPWHSWAQLAGQGSGRPGVPVTTLLWSCAGLSQSVPSRAGTCVLLCSALQQLLLPLNGMRLVTERPLRGQQCSLYTELGRFFCMLIEIILVPVLCVLFQYKDIFELPLVKAGLPCYLCSRQGFLPFFYFLVLRIEPRPCTCQTHVSSSLGTSYPCQLHISAVWLVSDYLGDHQACL